MREFKVIAVLTCFNRREKTLACLRSLKAQDLPEGLALSVILVDDGSTDGTGEAVREEFSDATVLEGDGSLFWNGGMHLAMGEALKQDPDFILWMNDDIELHQGGLSDVFDTYNELAGQESPGLIILGSMNDSEDGSHTYGGLVRSSGYHPLKFRRVAPDGHPQPVDTMNGNCVLIDRKVAELIGNVDPQFTHLIGDFDYGLRANKAGAQVWITAGYVGKCVRDAPPLDSAGKTGVTFREYIRSPKQMPIQEWKIFASRHGGFFWPLFWLSPYLQFLLRSFKSKLTG